MVEPARQLPGQLLDSKSQLALLSTGSHSSLHKQQRNHSFPTVTKTGLLTAASVPSCAAGGMWMGRAGAVAVQAQV